MLRWHVAVILAALCLAGSTLHAQAAQVLPPDTTTRRVILAAEQDLERAVLARDMVALDTLYAPEFQWHHWTGETDTKTSWLAFLKDSVSFTRHTATPTSFEFYPHAVWVSGILTSTGRYVVSGAFGYTIKYGRLWVSDSTGWKVREQVSRIVEPAP